MLQCRRMRSMRTQSPIAWPAGLKPYTTGARRQACEAAALKEVKAQCIPGTGVLCCNL